MKISTIPLPVFPFKLTRPELQTFYPRTRLYEILSTYVNHTAIWICGPAGCGKTTLVNSFLSTLQTPCIWYNVDEQDKDISSFFYYMGKAAEQINCEKYNTLPFLTQEFFPGIHSFTKRFFELFSDILPSRYIIVLDNYQDIGEGTLLHEVLCSAISGLQKRVTFFILSRKEPPDELAAARAKNKMEMLGWQHLQLDMQETGGVIKCISGRTFDQRTTADIHVKTDGWVSGLLLLLKRGEFDNIEPCMLTKKTPEVIFDYLNDAVFQRLDKDHQTILLTLCHLPVISHKAAAALCGKDAVDAMEKLNKENSFIYRVSENPSGYDFHPLFREFLQKRTTRFFSESNLAAILLKSADILKKEGNTAAAISLYIKTDHFTGAVDLILGSALEFSMQGRVATLLQWIHLLPTELVETNPWLLFWKGTCMIPTSPEAAKPFFQKSMTLFEGRNDATGCFMALSGIMDSISLQFSVFQELDQYIDRYSVFEKKLGDINLPDIHLKLTGSMLQALVLRQPNSPALNKWKARGWDILQQIKDVNKTVHIFSPLIILNIFKGDLQSAGHLLKMFTDVSHKKTAPLSYLILQDLKIFHSWMNGDFEAGLTAARKGMTVEKETGIHLIFLGLRVQGAASAIGLGKLDLAKQLLNEIPPFLDHQGIWMQGLYHIISSWLYSLTKNMAALRFHSIQAFKKNYLSGHPLVKSAAHLNIARFKIQTEKFRAADIHLKQCIQHASQSGLNQDKFIALLTRASIYLCWHKNKKAHEMLAEALKIGRQWNYRYGIFWHPGEMAKLCAEALRQNMETDYVCDLIISHGLMPEKLPLDIPAWPWPVSITSFGGFTILINGENIAVKRKAKKQPFSLIKYLLARGGKNIPEYDIQDALWPESDGDAAQNAYTTTLHRTRKLLKNKQALIHTHGRLSFNDRMVRTDTGLFELCCNKIEADLKKISLGEKNAIFKLNGSLKNLFSIYRGPFLDGNQQAWAIQKTEQLRSQYIDMLEKSGDTLTAHKNWKNAIQCYKEGLKIEPLTESFYEKLIHIYLKMKRPINAGRIYKQYETMLKTVSGYPLSDTIASLKSSILTKK